MVKKSNKNHMRGFYFFLKIPFFAFASIAANLIASRFLVFGEFFDFTCCANVVPRFAINNDDY
jgi:hypothetical protein